MDQNVLSPEQKRSLQVFQYNNINSLPETNTSLEPVLSYMKQQNDVLQENANTLQMLLNTRNSDPITNDLLLEEIKWNTYFYKKYNYQTQIMGIIIAICIILILLNKTMSRLVYIAGAGFILSIAFVYIIYLLWDLLMRDGTNFDEYNFYKYNGKYNKIDKTTNTVTDVSNCSLNKIIDYYA
jgi:uncharacterized membrane protein YkgB